MEDEERDEGEVCSRINAVDSGRQQGGVFLTEGDDECSEKREVQYHVH